MIDKRLLLGTEIENKLLRENRVLKFLNDVLFILCILLIIISAVFYLTYQSSKGEYTELSKSFTRISELNAQLAEKLSDKIVNQKGIKK